MAVCAWGEECLGGRGLAGRQGLGNQRGGRCVHAVARCRFGEGDRQSGIPLFRNISGGCPHMVSMLWRLVICAHRFQLYRVSSRRYSAFLSSLGPTTRPNLPKKAGLWQSASTPPCRPMSHENGRQPRWWHMAEICDAYNRTSHPTHKAWHGSSNKGRVETCPRQSSHCTSYVCDWGGNALRSPLPLPN